MSVSHVAATNFRAFIVLSALIGAAVACSSGSNGSTSTGGSGGGNDQTCSPSIGTIGCSCNLAVDAGGATGKCTDTLASSMFQGSPYCDQVMSGVACNNPGVASTSACPSANLVGTCFTSDSTVTDGVVRYYSPSWTLTTAEADCWSVSGQCFGPAN